MLRNVVLIAHRGYSSEAPENTMAAFLLAISHGYTDIEFDVQLSKDGVPVVFHDETLERVTDGSGRVNAHTFAELQELDAGSWFSPAYAGQRIPSLEDVLTRLRGLANIHIELKSDEAELAAKVIALLTSTGWLKDAQREPHWLAIHKPLLVISSFDRAQLLRSINLLPLTITHELLVETVTDESMAWAASHKVRSYHPSGKDITPELIRKARKLHLHIGAWWWTREEQDVSAVGHIGTRYAFVDAPHQHDHTLRHKLKQLKF